MPATDNTRSDPEQAPASPVPRGTWTVNPESTALQFVARHFFVSKIRGRFLDFSGTIVVGDTAVDTTVHGTAQAASIETGDEARDDHLRSTDFFDVEQWPTLTLVGKVVEPTRQGYLLRTDLTIRDVTRPVDFDLVMGTGSPTVLRATAYATINRKDFGLRWNATLETGGVVVADQVELVLEVEAVPSQD
jgi:polyisoprenoid-binding protein YceI